MSYHITHSFPIGYVLLCILCGLAYAAVLYYRNRGDGFSRRQTRLFALLRFLSVSLLCYLLLGPLVERLTRQVEEPMLLFVQDNSSSVADYVPEGFDLSVYLAEKEAFLEGLSGRFDVRRYRFGESFGPADSLGFDERMTDMASVFTGIRDRYSNRNVGAVVLASDGLFNRGRHPAHLAESAPYPLYTMALGDTIPRRDLVVGRITHNRYTYLGNYFPVEIEWQAFAAAGTESSLQLFRNDSLLTQESLFIASDMHHQTHHLLLEADRPGMQTYEVRLRPIPGETDLDNNRRLFFVEVIDDRYQVLILSQAPHPDVAALKLALDGQEAYEADTYLLSDFDGPLDAYSLVVLHQLPASGSVGPALRRILDSELPILFVLGEQTDIHRLNTAFPGLEIRPRSAEVAEARALPNPTFPLFQLPEAFDEVHAGLPPLMVPFAEYEVAGEAHIQLFQRLGQVNTRMPLVVFAPPGHRKMAAIMGEGLWRWRMNVFMHTSRHAAFDEWFSRMVQYLSLPEDRRRFRLTADPLITADEALLIEASLYNPAFEPVNDPDVHLLLREEGKNELQEYLMQRSGSGYRLQLPPLSAGNYVYEAKTLFGGEEYQAEGRLVVAPLALEGLRSAADHQLLHRMAESTGARMFYPGEWDALQDHLLDREDIRPLLYASRMSEELIHIRMVFFLLLFLLALEWALRKRTGAY